MSVIAVLVANWNKKDERLTVSDLAEGRIRFSDPLGALAYALAQRTNGKAVIIRPSFNETDEHGSFFREWRSFDGGKFAEIRWYMHDLHGNSLIEEPAVTKVCADTDIIIPNIPAPVCACEDDAPDSPDDEYEPMPDSSSGEKGMPRCFAG